jgi:hypothetical protein
MSQDDFLRLISSSPPDLLARDFFYAETAHLFPDQAAYRAFRERVAAAIPSAEEVAVVGSGNWRYSLNPEKGFREFGDHSDVDVAVVSSLQFHELWEEMRENHRRHYYALSYSERQRIRRNAENVYGGFISPEWIPNRKARQIHAYKRTLNTLSDRDVRFLKVKMMFFKNVSEAIDYYARGFRKAGKTTE